MHRRLRCTFVNVKSIGRAVGLITIIVMTRRQLWSVATTPHDVHIPLHSATSVSSWPAFHCRFAVSRSFEDAMKVIASSRLYSDRLLWQCSNHGGISLLTVSSILLAQRFAKQKSSVFWNCLLPESQCGLRYDHKQHSR